MKPMRASVNQHVRSGAVLASLELDAAAIPRGGAAELVVHGMEKTAESLVLAVDFSSRGRTIEAGRLYTYGEGEPADPRQARFAPLTLTLDVTEALAQLRGAPSLTLTLRILDARGAELADKKVFIDAVELRPGAAD